MRNEVFDKIKKEIIKQFKDKDWDCAHPDRLYMAVSKVLNSWISRLTLSEVFNYLKDFGDEDIKTLNEGLYEGVLKRRGYEAFNKTLLHRLIERDLYDEEDFNKLQFVKKVAGITLK